MALSAGCSRWRVPGPAVDDETISLLPPAAQGRDGRTSLQPGRMQSVTRTVDRDAGNLFVGLHEIIRFGSNAAVLRLRNRADAFFWMQNAGVPVGPLGKRWVDPPRSG